MKMSVGFQAISLAVLCVALSVALAEDFPLPGAATADGWDARNGAVMESAGEGIAFSGPGFAFLKYTPSFAEPHRFRNYKGIGFRIKGDGKPHRIVVGVSEGRFRFSFMLEDEEWHDIRLAWSDFVNRFYDLSLKMGGIDGDGMPPEGFGRFMLGEGWTLYHANETILPYRIELADLRLLEDVEPADALTAFPQRGLTEALDKMRNGKPALVVCNGDSITAGTGVGEQRYANILQQMLREYYDNEQIVVKTIAVGGASTLDLRVWAHSDYADAPLPDLATVMIGYNDRCFSLASKDSYKAGLDALCTQINSYTKGAPLLLFTPSPGTGEFYELLEPYAVAVREVAAERNLPLFDLSAFLKKKGHDTLCGFYFDRAHPNAAGHKMIAEELFKFLTTYSDDAK